MVEPLSSGVHSLASAVIRGEFDDTGVDSEILARIRDGEIELWIEQIEATGLFTELELGYLRLQWSQAPELLVAALVGDVDEVASERLTGERVTVGRWGRVAGVTASGPADEWLDVVNG